MPVSIRGTLSRTLALAALLASSVMGPAIAIESTSLPAAGAKLATNPALLPASCSIAPDEAVAIAVNTLSRTETGYRLDHPRHVATFTEDGVTFVPRRGDARWSWRFDGSESRIPGARRPVEEVAAVAPCSMGTRSVSYLRGDVEERYLFGDDHVEQQFILSRPPRTSQNAGSSDLVIAGTVESNGVLEQAGRGWIWRGTDGVVSIGDVRVYDAHGRDLPAKMTVQTNSTRIVVDGEGLATAEYPVTVDPEIGANDFRMSEMGNDGDFTYDGQFSAAAYDNIGNQYLVVWEGDDNTAGNGDGQFEIFGQRVDATSGAEIGTNDFRVSDMGPDGDGNYDASSPAVAFNSTNREFLVVWSGDDLSGTLVNGESEIFCQRINAINGAEVGANDFRVSDMGPDGDSIYDAVSPAVSYCATQGEYLVVWEGDDDSGTLVDGESEIFAQRLTAATGAEVGANDFRVSDMGTDGDPVFDAEKPAVVYGGGTNEYLVIWQGDDNVAGMVDGESEIFAQRIAAATGAEVGANDFRVSDMGTTGNALYDATAPSVAYASAENEYLVVWSGDDNTGGLADNEFEIFAQRIAAVTGAETGVNDFRVSDMGPDGDPSFDGLAPSVAYNPTAHEYYIVWEGDDSGGGLGAGEYEIFAQRVSAISGAQTGANDMRLSDLGTDGNILAEALHPAVAFASGPGQYLVTWEGDDDALGLADDEFEVWGQRVTASNGAETGVNDFRLSDMGPDGDIDYDAGLPAVAYNAADNQYFVVWQGDDDTFPLVDGETEIFGQRIDAHSGLEVGVNDMRISDMGPNSDPTYDAQSPAVVYNSVNREYLVVWSGEDNTGLLANGEFEIFGQRINAITGAEVGANDFRISDMGPDGNDLYDAAEPAVAYNPSVNEYIVVWEGDDLAGALVEGETEIFGQRLDGATGTAVGMNDFRISDMGTDGDIEYDAAVPAVAYNSSSNQYLVAWAGEDNVGFLANGEFEIFGQRIDAAGAELGTNDFRISDMGTDGDANFDAFAPAIAADPADFQYLVVWEGEDNTGTLVNGEFEIFGQRIDAFSGAAIGVNDFRISDMGTDGDPGFDAQAPSVTFNGNAREFLVVWEGDDNSGTLVAGEVEIFAQRLVADTGAETGDNDFRLSDMGPDGDAQYDATRPAIIYAITENAYLAVWSGDDNTGLLGPNEFEIYGQAYSTGTPSGVIAGGESIARLLVSEVSPNPVGARAVVSVVVPTAGSMTMAVFDVLGRPVSREEFQAAAPGRIDLDFDTAGLANGIYLVRISEGRASATRRIVVTR